MAHGRQIVDFVGLDFLDQPYEVGTIGHIAIMQNEITVFDMGILVQMVNPIGIEQGGSPF
jgi:hypothetical protein